MCEVKHYPPIPSLKPANVLYQPKDDCKTWSEPLVLDERESVSYPDGMQCEDGKIYMAYDRERYGAREILYSVFTEEDIEAKAFISDGSLAKKIISKLYTERPE